MGICERGKLIVLDLLYFMKTEFPDTAPKITLLCQGGRSVQKMYNGYVAISAAKKHYSHSFS